MNAVTGAAVAIVDDDEALRVAFGRLLRVTGFRPTAYESAEAFLASPARNDYACLLVDIHLGGLSGLELLRRIRADGMHTPLVFVTAYDDPAVRAEAVSAGCAGFFRKTDEGNRIIEALEGITAR